MLYPQVFLFFLLISQITSLKGSSYYFVVFSFSNLEGSEATSNVDYTDSEEQALDYGMVEKCK